MSGYTKVVNDCMGIKPGESVLVLTDDNKIEIAKKLYKEARTITDDVYVLVMKPRRVSGTELPAQVAEFMKNVDVVLAPTSVSMTHTQAKINAAKAGTRVASMPNITEDMFDEGALNADFDLVIRLTEKLTKMLSEAKSARVEKDGKVLNIDLGDRKGVGSPGVYRNPGEAGNVPSGEAYIAPLENGTNGEIVIDGSMVSMGLLEEPLYVTMKDGKISDIKGDKGQLGILFESEENHTIAELGIGTNPAARLTGVILEDEKIYGTIHVAFGTNVSFGGENLATCHLDGIVLKPTLYLDEILVMKDGEVVIEL